MLNIMLVDLIDFILQELNRSPLSLWAALKSRPVGGVHIFDDIEPPFREKRIQHVKAGALMTCDVGTIIEYDVDPAHLGDDVAKKLRVILRADPNPRKLTVKGSAGGVDIDAEN